MLQPPGTHIALIHQIATLSGLAGLSY